MMESRVDAPGAGQQERTAAAVQRGNGRRRPPRLGMDAAAAASGPVVDPKAAFVPQTKEESQASGVWVIHQGNYNEAMRLLNGQEAVPLGNVILLLMHPQSVQGLALQGRSVFQLLKSTIKGQGKAAPRGAAKAKARKKKGQASKSSSPKLPGKFVKECNAISGSTRSISNGLLLQLMVLCIKQKYPTFRTTEKDPYEFIKAFSIYEGTPAPSVAKSDWGANLRCVGLYLIRKQVSTAEPLRLKVDMLPWFRADAYMLEHILGLPDVHEDKMSQITLTRVALIVFTELSNPGALGLNPRILNAYETILLGLIANFAKAHPEVQTLDMRARCGDGFMRRPVEIIISVPEAGDASHRRDFFLDLITRLALAIGYVHLAQTELLEQRFRYFLQARQARDSLVLLGRTRLQRIFPNIDFNSIDTAKVGGDSLRFLVTTILFGEHVDNEAVRDLEVAERAAALEAARARHATAWKNFLKRSRKATAEAAQAERRSQDAQRLADDLHRRQLLADSQRQAPKREMLSTADPASPGTPGRQAIQGLVRNSLEAAISVIPGVRNATNIATELANQFAGRAATKLFKRFSWEPGVSMFRLNGQYYDYDRQTGKLIKVAGGSGSAK